MYSCNNAPGKIGQAFSVPRMNGSGPSERSLPLAKSSSSSSSSAYVPAASSSSAKPWADAVATFENTGRSSLDAITAQFKVTGSTDFDEHLSESRRNELADKERRRAIAAKKKAEYQSREQTTAAPKPSLFGTPSQSVPVPSISFYHNSQPSKPAVPVRPQSSKENIKRASSSNDGSSQKRQADIDLASPSPDKARPDKSFVAKKTIIRKAPRMYPNDLQNKPKSKAKPSMSSAERSSSQSKEKVKAKRKNPEFEEPLSDDEPASKKQASSSRSKVYHIKTGTELETFTESEDEAVLSDDMDTSLDDVDLLGGGKKQNSQKDLCPFCIGEMPDVRSLRLDAALQELLASPNIECNPTRANPNGMKLPFIETASFCALHRQENEIIPAGIKKKWPATVDWNVLAERVKDEAREHLADIIMKRAPSSFLDRAMKDWKEQGALAMSNVQNQFATFDLEMPGYFGPKGFEVISSTIVAIFVESDQGIPILTSWRVEPLDVETYVRRVLVPECSIIFIMKDLDVSREKADEIRLESRAFGQALYSRSGDDEAFVVSQEAGDLDSNEKAAKRRKFVDGDDDDLMIQSGMNKRPPTAQQSSIRNFFKAKEDGAAKADSSAQKKKAKKNSSSQPDDLEMPPSEKPVFRKPKALRDLEAETKAKGDDDDATVTKVKGKLVVPQERKDRKDPELETMSDLDGTSSDSSF